MSKLACDCGHLIMDQTDDLPYKASLLKAQDESGFYDKVSADLADLVAAVQHGTRGNWLTKHFLTGYPRDLPHDQVISDYLSGILAEFQKEIFQCERCGGLWVEGETSNRFEKFESKTPGGSGILSSRLA